MKKLAFFIALVSISLPTFAQDPVGKGKFATFGFDLGINRSDLSFGSVINDGEDITNGLGYRLGLVSNFQVTRKFSIAPKAELSFNAGRLSQDNTSYEVSPTNLELIGHLKYKFSRRPFSPYIIAGPNWRIPLSDSDDIDLVPTEDDVAIDIGGGIDFPIGSIRVSPEIRYSFGLSNINSSSNFSDLQYNNIVLMLVFSGR